MLKPYWPNVWEAVYPTICHGEVSDAAKLVFTLAILVMLNVELGKCEGNCVSSTQTLKKVVNYVSGIGQHFGIIPPLPFLSSSSPAHDHQHHQHITMITIVSITMT